LGTCPQRKKERKKDQRKKERKIKERKKEQWRVALKTCNFPGIKVAKKLISSKDMFLTLAIQMCNKKRWKFDSVPQNAKWREVSTESTFTARGEESDPATPGYHLRSVDTRKPRDCNNPPISS